MDKKTLLILKEVAKADGLSFHELVNAVQKIKPYEAQQIIIYLAKDGYIDVGDHALSNPFSFNHISLTGKGIDAIGESKGRKAYEIATLIATILAALFSLIGILLQSDLHVLQWISHCIPR